MAKRTKQQAPDPWEHVEETARPNLPDYIAREKKLQKRGRWLKFHFFTGFGAYAGLFFAVLLLVDQVNTPIEDVTAPRTRADAIVAVNTWLGSDPSPLPGSSVVSWDSFETLAPAPGVGDDALDQVTRERHTVILRTQTNTTMAVDVLLAVDSAGRATMVGTPALSTLLPPTDDLRTSALWPGVPGAQLENPARQAVESWAAAFTSGDPVALRQVVGDPDTSKLYLPLSGLSAATVTVNDSAELLDSSGERTGTQVANVTLALTWPGQTYSDQETPPGSTYDVLILDAKTGAPRVVAWGAPGSGPSLTAYENGLVGVESSLPQETGDLDDEEVTDEPQGEDTTDSEGN